MNQPLNTLKILAHQGIQGSVPSNSFAAIVAAFDAATDVEFDLYRVVSNEDGSSHIICCHPETYFLFIDKKGMVNAAPFPLSWEECCNLYWQGIPLAPSLPEVLEHWSRSQRTTNLQLEIKGPNIPEVLVPLLQQQIAAGLLDLDKLSLTGLCYPGDRSRITVVRALWPEVPLVLPLRGDLAQDGFSSIAEVVAFAQEQQIWMVTVQRRNLTQEMAQAVSDAGIVLGTFHGRTSDEFEAAQAVGAAYIAADWYKGPTIADYHAVQHLDPVVYWKLFTAGFYVLRDWIWEIGWDVERAIATSPVHLGEEGICVSAQGQLTTDALLVQHDDAAWVSPYRADSDRALDGELAVTPFLVNHAHRGAFDSEKLSDSRLLALIHPHNVAEQVAQLSSLLGFSWDESAATYELLDALVVQPTNGGGMDLRSSCVRQVLIRAGRIVGMLAFASLNPRHSPRDRFSITVRSNLCNASAIAKNAAAEQVQAQALRSGAFNVSVVFE